MPDYEKLYHVLFNKVSDVIEDLQAIQQTTEAIYMATDEKKDED